MPWKLPLLPLYNPLKSPVGAHVHKTTYAPMLYTSLYVMFLMRADPFTWASGRGFGPGNLNFFEPQMAHAKGLDAISQAQKSLDFQGSKL